MISLAAEATDRRNNRGRRQAQEQNQAPRATQGGDNWAQSVDRGMVCFGTYRGAEYRNAYWDSVASSNGDYYRFFCGTSANGALVRGGVPPQEYINHRKRELGAIAPECDLLRYVVRGGVASLDSAGRNFRSEERRFAFKIRYANGLLSSPLSVNRNGDFCFYLIPRLN